MGNLVICTGEYAQTPYYLSTVCMNVYCAEELCYLFAINPFIITPDIMDMSLVEWIENECKLKDLADRLIVLFRKGSQLGEFVNTILDYVNYCSEEERNLIDETLKSNTGLSEFERKKHQGDYLLRNAKYEAAIEEYESLLGELPDVEAALKPVIFHNIGYAYAHLFMFDIAAKYYKRSYEMSGLIDSAMQFLSSLRMYMPQDKYLRFIAENKEYYDVSLALEAKIKKAEGNFEASQENRMLSALKIYRDEGNVTSYYEEIDKIITKLKDGYINMVVN